MSYSTGSRRPLGERHAGVLLAEILAGCGVRHIFGVPGGQTLPLYDAIYKGVGGLKHVLMRDERNAAYAAVAYARATGGIGVYDATVGPGAALTPVALAEAYNSSTPLLALFSDIAHDWDNLAEYGAASQALDQLSMVKPMVKWAGRVNSVRALPDMVRTALRRATTGRPGPVVLDLPEDIFRGDASSIATGLTDPALGRFPGTRLHPAPDDVDRAASLISKAERPLLLVGGGGMLSNAVAGVAAVMGAFQLPLAYTWTGKGIAADTDSLNLGQLGPNGTRCAQSAARAADLILMVGCKSAQNSTYGWTLPSPEQKLIHLDIDPAEIGKVFRTDVGIVADAEAGLQALAAAASRHVDEVGAARRREWLGRCEGWKQAWSEEVLAEARSTAEPIRPHRVVKTLEKLMTPDDTLVCDASFSSGWGGVFFDQKAPGWQCIFPRGMAGLGFGLPAAIGARVARPKGQVVCLAGDGGFGYSVGELATLHHHGLKVISVVLNNSVLGWIRYVQRYDYDDNFQSSQLPEINYARAAEGLGCKGIKVDRLEHLGPALQEAFAADEPVVVDVRTEPWASPLLPHADKEKAERQQAQTRTG